MGRDAVAEGPEVDSDEECAPVPSPVSDRPVGVERRTDARGDHFVVWWPNAVEFVDGKSRKSCWFNVRAVGEGEARRRAREYCRNRHCELAAVWTLGRIGPSEERLQGFPWS